MEIGNLSEIIAAVTAILALVAAAVAAWYTKGQLESSDKQLAEVQSKSKLKEIGIRKVMIVNVGNMLREFQLG
ncbi:hypothetical protein [uncultured Rothia sp.]|uniref:hypothetical protein n=1 Tax=uncultured Rothia sp. TaxID=316088 RepID=UPI003216A14F